MREQLTEKKKKQNWSALVTAFENQPITIADLDALMKTSSIRSKNYDLQLNRTLQLVNQR